MINLTFNEYWFSGSFELLFLSTSQQSIPHTKKGDTNSSFRAILATTAEERFAF